MRTGLPFVRLYVFICLSTITFINAGAQSIQTPDGKFEVGLALGPSFFVGDLGGNRGEGKTFVKDVNLPLTKLMKGLFVNFYPSEWLGLRLGISKGEVKGFDSVIDSKGTAERFRKQRNLGIQIQYFRSLFRTRNISYRPHGKI